MPTPLSLSLPVVATAALTSAQDAHRRTFNRLQILAESGNVHAQVAATALEQLNAALWHVSAAERIAEGMVRAQAEVQGRGGPHARLSAEEINDWSEQVLAEAGQALAYCRAAGETLAREAERVEANKLTVARLLADLRSDHRGQSSAASPCAVPCARPVRS